MVDYNNVRYNTISNRQRSYTDNKNKGLTYIIFISALMILGLAFVRAIDKHIEGQDIMLCESAKISGNDEYLKKCQCYYEGLDISCLQNK